jgi:ribosomal peptide maturation radical SAM protein 1
VEDPDSRTTTAAAAVERETAAGMGGPAAREREAAAGMGGPVPNVVLVNMPFGGYRQPSLALGLLKATLAPLNVRVTVLDATLTFAGMLSPDVYEVISTWRAEDLLGDWVFAGHLPRSTPGAIAAASVEEYLEQVLGGGAPEHRVPYFGKPPLTPQLRSQLLGAREQAGELLDACLAELLALAPTIVGFTSMFHQTAASLALAGRAKAAAPDVLVVFGGAACRGEMGADLLRSFPDVDAVAGGEGEPVLPELVRRQLAGESLAGIPGLLVRQADGSPSSASPVNLDTLPHPDFGDYFERLFDGPLKAGFIPRLPFEASRGCWWGEKSRCTFCGQASEALTYRSKSAPRALDELQALTERYSGCPVVVTDEIVPPAHLDDFLPLLPARLPDLEIVYFEVRPDLSRHHLELVAHAGVRRVEAGIETLSTPQLKLMRKGTNLLQNVQFLKWARELGLHVVWNLLWGLPGEDPGEYERMAALVPLLTHLQPPNSVGAFRLDRFSPFFERPVEHGLEHLRPYPAAGYVYGLPEERLSRLVPSLAFDYRDGQPVELYTTPLAERVEAWKEAWPHSVLAYADHGDSLVLFERRPGFDGEELTVLDGVHRALYLACDAARTVGSLARQLGEEVGAPLRDGDLEQALVELVETGVMLHEGSRYLSLALRMPDRSAGGEEAGG